MLICKNEIFVLRIVGIEGASNARRIMSSKFVESGHENIGDSCCEQFVTTISCQCNLETIEVCLSRLQELE
jgi:hypothetical protein